MRTLVVCAVMACASAALRAQDYKAYQNYDFVPGDRIVFEDDFAADRDGEFPAHWRLEGGQGVVNRFQGEPALALTEGNYAVVTPRLSTKSYLSDPFTVEFDFFPKAGGFEKLVLMLRNGDDEKQIVFGDEVSTSGLEHDLSGSYPGGNETWEGKWHHVALAYRNGQVKCYEDQNRVLVAPDFEFKPASLALAGVGDAENPLIVKNVRIATGGGMTLVDKLTKDGKIVTHGIMFDVNSARIQAQSMGTIGEIVKLMKGDPSLKLEVGGHTDATGDAAKNQTLSQARADAVKKLLVDQGVDAARLSTKGYGAAKPIDKNDTPEAKANNRRVEFTKIG